MTNEWTPWIDHDGKGCPCVGKYGQWELCSYVPFPIGSKDKHGRILINSRTIEGIASHGSVWVWGNECMDVIRYRIRKPRALSMLEKIARDVGTLVDA